MLDDLILWIGEKSSKLVALGLFMILAATGWDIVVSGVRGFLEYSVNYKGMIINFIGVAIITLAWFVEKNLEG